MNGDLPCIHFLQCLFGELIQDLHDMLQQPLPLSTLEFMERIWTNHLEHVKPEWLDRIGEVGERILNQISIKVMLFRSTKTYRGRAK